MFQLVTPYSASIGQRKSIDKLTRCVKNSSKHTTLLGVTGSGKTFVTANVIENINQPTLVLAHNKTLAGQLFQEYREFFPHNAVEYFVSYYDYYQPESYKPATDTYIEKDASVNEEIDKLRLSTTTSLLTRSDVIVVSSVSCIYALGSPEEYQKQLIRLLIGMKIRIKDLAIRLNQLQYKRDDYDFTRGSFRIRGDTVDIHFAYQHFGVRLEFLEDKLKDFKYFDPISGEYMTNIESEKHNPKGSNHTYTKAQEDFIKSNFSETSLVTIYPAKHYIAPEENFDNAISQIKRDVYVEVQELKRKKKDLEAHRLKQRINYDLEMMQEIGYCKGIENYSRYFDGRKKGETPYTLLDFFPKDYLMVIDESHITIPQIRGMYNGDRSRKQTLVDYGFRLESALDNRPLRFEEFQRKTNQVIYTSATPSEYELNLSNGKNSNCIIELLTRPTGIVDPKVKVVKTDGQIQDVEQRVLKRLESSKTKSRVIITTLTKRMAEELTNYLKEKGYKVAYLHGDIETLERADILTSLRKGEFDVLVGINLLREGIDLPEVSLVCILDADKEGFLRSTSALIQVMGRAARHIDGEAIMYANTITKSMKQAMDEIERRRKAQIKYNDKYDIKPKSITKPIRERILERKSTDDKKEKIQLDLASYEFKTMSKKEQKKIIKGLELKMKESAAILEFEIAGEIRDEIKRLKKLMN